MKLARYGEKGKEKPGMLDAGGNLRDLSGVLRDIVPELLTPEALAKLRAINPETLPRVSGTPRLGVCVWNPGKVIAVGQNYKQHVAELGSKMPVEPVLFIKTANTLGGANDDVPIPRGAEKMDWEVEMAVIIGRRAKYIAEAEALSHVAGYSVANDVSEREWQKNEASGGQWTKGKCADGFLPLGPYLVTADEVPAPQKLTLSCHVNGKQMQNGTTGDMIFPVARLISYISQKMTLEPGDVIITGTPPGVGGGMKPPQFLKHGDVAELEISGIGRQKQRFVADKP